MFMIMDEYTEKQLWDVFKTYDKLYEFLLTEDTIVINKEGGENLESQWIKLATRTKAKMNRFRKQYEAYRKAEYEAYMQEDERKRKEDERIQAARDSW